MYIALFIYKPKNSKFEPGHKSANHKTQLKHAVANNKKHQHQAYPLDLFQFENCQQKCSVSIFGTKIEPFSKITNINN